MPRIARVVIPQCPHHITQRGVRSMQVFLNDADRRKYLNLLKANGKKYGVEFLAYCLMSNHVHIVAVPESGDSLARAIGEAHRKYTREVNLREDVRGYLFQGRFYSCPTDERYFVTAALYTERNPVRAGICRQAWGYQWSSAAFHAGAASCDPLVDKKIAGISPDEWMKMLKNDPDSAEELRHHSRTGRPAGAPEFISRAELLTGRQLFPRPAGRKGTDREGELIPARS
ncbi:MAG: transposase [Elusimicrobia bacterium]|nr:MAG: transposase [Elusimicrobiota bacterium]KAF0154312.1 MAG: transposase [Elusimicrobiota bacterium]